jgi:hypothetical protein
MGQAKRYGRQRELMRKLFARHGGNQVQACEEYAASVRCGIVPHKSNRNKVAPEKYAVSLWYDGTKKGMAFRSIMLRILY